MRTITNRKGKTYEVRYASKERLFVAKRRIIGPITRTVRACNLRHLLGRIGA